VNEFAADVRECVDEAHPGGCLGDHHVARIDQDVEHELDCLGAARGDHEVLRAGDDALIARELGEQDVDQFRDARCLPVLQSPIAVLLERTLGGGGHGRVRQGVHIGEAVDEGDIAGRLARVAQGSGGRVATANREERVQMLL
jgi:hypothetical protein